MKTDLILTSQTREKTILQRAIKKKKAILALLSSKFEMLKVELDFIKREYYYRVGSLIDRDNILDMEIIMHKTLLMYIKSGLTHEQALEKINGKYYSEDTEKIKKEEAFYTERAEEIAGSNYADNIMKDLKQLWKKAVMKFHPDLASDQDEKKIREETMKLINHAYSERDFQKLQEIYNNTHIINGNDSTLEDLERILVDLENKVINVTKEFAELQKTEWNRWKTKMRIAKKSGIDIFKEMENSLLDDVVRKMRILSELKQEIENI